MTTMSGAGAAMPGHPASTFPAPRAYRINDAAVMLSLSRSSIYELLKTGQLRAIKLAGRTLIPASEIQRLVG
jgi:excisionase family DNA binding protein